MRKITLLNGPNLNLLGLREPDRYGVGTLAEIVAECSAFSSDNGFDLNSFQSNSEADLAGRNPATNPMKRDMNTEKMMYSHATAIGKSG